MSRLINLWVVSGLWMVLLVYAYVCTLLQYHLMASKFHSNRPVRSNVQEHLFLSDTATQSVPPSIQYLFGVSTDGRLQPTRTPPWFPFLLTSIEFLGTK